MLVQCLQRRVSLLACQRRLVSPHVLPRHLCTKINDTSSTPADAKTTVIYRGAFINHLRLLVRLKIAQVSPHERSPSVSLHYLQLGAAGALAVPVGSWLSGTPLPTGALALSGRGIPHLRLIISAAST